jgi:hypothetical protein
VSFLRHGIAANTIDDVIAASQDYLRVWSEVLHRLPSGCRPAGLSGADEVLRAAAMLDQTRRQVMSGGTRVGPELEVTTEFFLAAAAKIEQLGESEGRSPADDGSLSRRRPDT